MRFLRWIALAALHIVAVIALLWAGGAFYFDLPVSPVLRQIATVVWLLGGLAAWFFLRPRWRWRAGVAVAFAAVLIWWLNIEPRQDRDWRPDVAVLASADIAGDHLTIHNVRNCDYRTETDYTPVFDTRSYDFSQLRGLDLFLTNWGSPYMAHPIFSFDFGPQGHLCFSVETRPERGEAYSAVGGLYRQFELIYIPADERDVIRLRTNFRQGEEVYLYRLKLPLEQIRGRLMEYLGSVNALHAHAVWYNAVTNNCTTSLRLQHDPAKRTPWDWRILLNGHADEMLYERGVLDTSMPFAELKQRVHINDAARAAGTDPNFSALVRVGRPGFGEPAKRP